MGSELYSGGRWKREEEEDEDEDEVELALARSRIWAMMEAALVVRLARGTHMALLDMAVV